MSGNRPGVKKTVIGSSNWLRHLRWTYSASLRQFDAQGLVENPKTEESKVAQTGVANPNVETLDLVTLSSRTPQTTDATSEPNNVGDQTKGPQPWPCPQFCRAQQARNSVSRSCRPDCHPS